MITNALFVITSPIGKTKQIYCCVRTGMSVYILNIWNHIIWIWV